MGSRPWVETDEPRRAPPHHPISSAEPHHQTSTTDHGDIAALTHRRDTEELYAARFRDLLKAEDRQRSSLMLEFFSTYPRLRMELGATHKRPPAVAPSQTALLWGTLAEPLAPAAAHVPAAQARTPPPTWAHGNGLSGWVPEPESHFMVSRHRVEFDGEHWRAVEQHRGPALREALRHDLASAAHVRVQDVLDVSCTHDGFVVVCAIRHPTGVSPSEVGRLLDAYPFPRAWELYNDMCELLRSPPAETGYPPSARKGNRVTAKEARSRVDALRQLSAAAKRHTRVDSRARDYRSDSDSGGTSSDTDAPPRSVHARRRNAPRPHSGTQPLTAADSAPSASVSPTLKREKKTASPSPRLQSRTERGGGVDVETLSERETVCLVKAPPQREAVSTAAKGEMNPTSDRETGYHPTGDSGCAVHRCSILFEHAEFVTEGESAAESAVVQGLIHDCSTAVRAASSVSVDRVTAEKNAAMAFVLATVELRCPASVSLAHVQAALATFSFPETWRSLHRRTSTTSIHASHVTGLTDSSKRPSEKPAVGTGTPTVHVMKQRLLTPPSIEQVAPAAGALSAAGNSGKAAAFLDSVADTQANREEGAALHVPPSGAAEAALDRFFPGQMWETVYPRHRRVVVDAFVEETAQLLGVSQQEVQIRSAYASQSHGEPTPWSGLHISFLVKPSAAAGHGREDTAAFPSRVADHPYLQLHRLCVALLDAEKAEMSPPAPLQRAASARSGRGPAQLEQQTPQVAANGDTREEVTPPLLSLFLEGEGWSQIVKQNPAALRDAFVHDIAVALRIRDADVTVALPLFKRAEGDDTVGPSSGKDTAGSNQSGLLVLFSLSPKSFISGEPVSPALLHALAERPRMPLMWALFDSYAAAATIPTPHAQVKKHLDDGTATAAAKARKYHAGSGVPSRCQGATNGNDELSVDVACVAFLPNDDGNVGAPSGKATPSPAPTGVSEGTEQQQLTATFAHGNWSCVLASAEARSALQLAFLDDVRDALEELDGVEVHRDSIELSIRDSNSSAKGASAARNGDRTADAGAAPPLLIRVAVTRPTSVTSEVVHGRVAACAYTRVWDLYEKLTRAQPEADTARDVTTTLHRRFPGSTWSVWASRQPPAGVEVLHSRLKAETAKALGLREDDVAISADITPDALDVSVELLASKRDTIAALGGPQGATRALAAHSFLPVYDLLLAESDVGMPSSNRTSSAVTQDTQTAEESVSLNMAADPKQVRKHRHRSVATTNSRATTRSVSTPFPSVAGLATVEGVATTPIRRAVPPAGGHEGTAAAADSQSMHTLLVEGPEWHRVVHDQPDSLREALRQDIVAALRTSPTDTTTGKTEADIPLSMSAATRVVVTAPIAMNNGVVVNYAVADWLADDSARGDIDKRIEASPLPRTWALYEAVTARPRSPPAAAVVQAPLVPAVAHPSSPSPSEKTAEARCGSSLANASLASREMTMMDCWFTVLLEGAAWRKVAQLHEAALRACFEEDVRSAVSSLLSAEQSVSVSMVSTVPLGEQGVLVHYTITPLTAEGSAASAFADRGVVESAVSRHSFHQVWALYDSLTAPRQTAPAMQSSTLTRIRPPRAGESSGDTMVEAARCAKHTGMEPTDHPPSEPADSHAPEEMGVNSEEPVPHLAHSAGTADQVVGEHLTGSSASDGRLRSRTDEQTAGATCQAGESASTAAREAGRAVAGRRKRKARRPPLNEVTSDEGDREHHSRSTASPTEGDTNRASSERCLEHAGEHASAGTSIETVDTDTTEEDAVAVLEAVASAKANSPREHSCTERHANASLNAPTLRQEEDSLAQLAVAAVPETAVGAATPRANQVRAWSASCSLPFTRVSSVGSSSSTLSSSVSPSSLPRDSSESLLTSQEPRMSDSHEQDSSRGSSTLLSGSRSSDKAVLSAENHSEKPLHDTREAAQPPGASPSSSEDAQIEYSRGGRRSIHATAVKVRLPFSITVTSSSSSSLSSPGQASAAPQAVESDMRSDAAADEPCRPSSPLRTTPQDVSVDTEPAVAVVPDAGEKPLLHSDHETARQGSASQRAQSSDTTSVAAPITRDGSHPQADHAQRAPGGDWVAAAPAAPLETVHIPFPAPPLGLDAATSPHLGPGLLAARTGKRMAADTDIESLHEFGGKPFHPAARPLSPLADSLDGQLFVVLKPSAELSSVLSRLQLAERLIKERTDCLHKRRTY